MNVMGHLSRIWSRPGTYVLTAAGLICSYPLLKGIPWQGDDHLHTMMEVVATCLALLVGSMALVRYYSRKNGTILLIGVGFLGTALFDGYHAVVTSSHFAFLIDADKTSLAPWSWLASRIFLSVMLATSWLCWRYETQHGKEVLLGEKSVYFGTALLVAGSFTFFALVPLPRAYFPELFIHRPEELVPAVFFAIALAGYLTKGKWRNDDFEHWLVLSLIVGLVSQVVFMPFSATLFDMQFDAAHLLKMVSYVSVLAGLLANMYAAFRVEINHTKELTAAREEAENALAKLSEYKFVLDEHAIVAVTDQSGRITYVNDKFCRISKYDRHELVGQNHRILKSGYHDASYYKSFWSTISRGDVWTGEFKNLAKDGSEYWVSTIVAPFRDAKGRISQYISIRTDITQSKRNQEELRRKEEDLVERVAELEDTQIRLEEQAGVLRELSEQLSIERDRAQVAAKAKTDFLATMSHEIRTPMNGVLGMLHLLADTELSGEQRDLTETASVSAESLLTIINDILDVSKLEEGRVELEAVDFDLFDLVHRVVALFKIQASEKQLQMLSEFPPDLPRFIRADPTRVRQILVNLVGNAIKFTNEGAVTIALSYGRDPSGDLLIRVMVRDTGIGISPESQVRLFERFSQADSSTTRQYGGSGLGLAISKQLSEIMGGQIGVDSVENAGSVFWFTFRAQTGNAETVNSKKLLAEADAQNMRVLRVLVAEDNAINRKMITTLFTRRGHTVEVAENGRLALERVQDGEFDVVLMDIQMPEMDGIQAMQAIRALDGEKRSIPIVALTANAVAGDRQRYLEAGMDDYVSKPVDPEELFTAVNRVVVPKRESTDIDDEPGVCPNSGATSSEEESTASMSTPLSAMPIFDEGKLQRMREALGEDSLSELLSDVPGETARLLQDLQGALAKGDFDAAQDHAHTIKGLASNFAAVRIALLAKDVEDEVKETGSYTGHLGELENAIDEARDWLDQTPRAIPL